MTARRPIGQTKITATAPLRAEELQRRPIKGSDVQPAVAHLVVDSDAFAKASPEAIADLQTLLRAVIIRRGGDTDRIVYTAEPVGPQIKLAAVNGRKL